MILLFFVDYLLVIMLPVQKYLSLVRFPHTVFALPFALTMYVYAHHRSGQEFNVLLLAQLLLCMVFARNAAMAFNRYADRVWDALNPRTDMRELPSGQVSPRAALVFVLINAAGFVGTTFFINRLVFYLSPLALVIVLGYSFMKRFSCLSHFVLGWAMSIAPMGAFLAVTGAFAPEPFLWSALVLFWGAGFDIIYSLQDVDFDRLHGLHSIPVRLGIRRALMVSSWCHILSALCLLVIGLTGSWGWWYWLGAALFVCLLIYQHLLVKPHDLRRVDAAFFTVNGAASLAFALLVVTDMVF